MQNTKKIHELLMSCLFGMLAATGFAPTDYFFATIIGFLGLFQLYLGQHRFILLSFFIGYFAVGTPWLFNSIHYFGHLNYGISLLVTVVAISIAALIPQLCQRLIVKKSTLKLNDLWRKLPIILVLSEWLRSHFLFSGFPWLVFGISQIHGPFAYLLPILGCYGCSWFIFLLLGLVMKLWYEPSRTSVVLFFLLCSFLATLLYVKPEHWTKHLSTKPIRFAAIKLPSSFTDINQKLAAYTQQSLPFVNHSDLIIWPESALPAVVDAHSNLISQLSTTLNTNQTALMFGAFSTNNNYLFNTVFALYKGHVSLNKKHKLVAFGEYFPIPEYISKILKQHHIPVSHLTASHLPPTEFAIRHHIKIFPIICYEIAFSNWIRAYAKQSNILVSIHKMTWFRSKQASAQQLELAQVRSLENGKPQIFVSEYGPIATINDLGQVTAKFPEQQTLVASGTIIPQQGTTPFGNYGNWPWLTSAGLILLLL